MNPEPIDPARADELVARALDGQVPGAALAVVRSGRPLFTSCYGLADLEWNTPVTPTTVFRLASLSKPLTALTVMSMERDGLLDLDAPIHRYLPDYPEHAGEVRLRHLLTHTSGIPNFVTAPGFRDAASRLDHTDDQVLARFATLPLEFAPGSRYAYSNSGYRLLDIIVARVAGAPFARVLTERVLEPAGMRDTRVLSDEEIVPARARGYRRGPDGYLNASYLSMTVPGGAGGIGSTLSDLLRFDRALADGVLADAPLRRRLFAPVRLSSGRCEGYGLGWGLTTYRSRLVVNHTGGIEGFSSIYVHVPEEDTSVIMLTNLEGYRCAPAALRLIDRVLGLPPSHRPEPVPVPQSILGERAGEYRDGAELLRVTAGPGHLVVSQAGRTHRMRPVDPTVYVDDTDADVVLRFHDDEPVPACTLHYPLVWVTGYR